MSLQTFHLPFDVTLLPVKKLTAGDITCLYENGNLRYICSGGKEVLRMIYPAVRDERWDTAPYLISDEIIKQDEAGFTINYTAVYQLDHIRYKAAFDIEGKNNTITFSMKGVALSTFNTNRIGICLLHAVAENAGREVVITKPDGNSYAGNFPIHISPHQPFMQVQQMQWIMKDGTEALLIVEGEIFETEDQRNWTDATYKTYPRPLALGYPFQLQAGEVMHQQVRVTVTPHKNAFAVTLPPADDTDERKIPFPKIGYCRPKRSRHLTEAEVKRLQQVPFDHYRVALHLHETDWLEELATAFSEAEALATKLELVVFFDGEIASELKALIEGVRPRQQYVASILALHRKQKVITGVLFQQIYMELKNAFPAIQTGYGTDGHFADVNRNRPEFAAYDFVSFSIHPQAHASDTRTIMENLSGQADTITTARTFSGDKKMHISPVTIPDRSSADADPRHGTWFAACWTLQAIGNLSGADRITFYETTGSHGIITKHTGSSGQTLQSANSTTPVYQVLEAIKAFGPAWIITQKSNDKSKNALLIENREGGRLLFTADNFTATKES